MLGFYGYIRNIDNILVDILTNISVKQKYFEIQGNTLLNYKKRHKTKMKTNVSLLHYLMKGSHLD